MLLHCMNASYCWLGVRIGNFEYVIVVIIENVTVTCAVLSFCAYDDDDVSFSRKIFS